MNQDYRTQMADSIPLDKRATRFKGLSDAGHLGFETAILIYVKYVKHVMYNFTFKNCKFKRNVLKVILVIYLQHSRTHMNKRMSLL